MFDSTSKNDFFGLTSVRGLAAIWIVIYHIRPFLYREVPESMPILPYVYSGYLAVDVFSFLSGFVITYSYGELLRNPSAKNAAKYVWYRLARIYPLLLFVLGLYTCFYLYVGRAPSLSQLPETDALIRQIFMINSLGLEDVWAWNVPSWTVSVEWYSYLIFVFLAPLIVRINNAWLALVLAIATFLGTMLFMYSIGRIDLASSPHDLGGLKIVGEFYTGCLMYQVYKNSDVRHWPWQWIGFIALLVAIYFSPWFHALSAFCFAVLVFSLTQIENEGVLGAIFGNRVVIYLGEISYSIYLIHWLSLDVWEATPWWGEQAPMVQVFIGLAFIFFASVICYHYVERTSRQFMRKLV